MALMIENTLAEAEVFSGGPEVLESLACEWRQLCDEGLWNQDPFCLPDWSIAYTRAYEVKHKIVAVTARVSGRLRAVLPLVRERALMWGIPVTILRRGVGDTPRFDLALTGDEKEAGLCVGALWRSLRDDLSWDAIELTWVPESAALWSLVAEAEDDGFPTGFRPTCRTPIVSLTDLSQKGEDPWLAQASPQFRQELRRKTRGLLKLGSLRFERHERATPAVLERYYDLERSTWKGEKGCDVLSDSRRLRYFNEIAHAAERAGNLSIFFLLLEERLIAAIFGMTYGGKCFYLRCAFDSAYGRYSPGQILINLVLRDCVARQVSALDFLGEAHAYKQRWTSQRVEHGCCYIFRRNLFGRALHALKFRAIPLGRKLLRRPLPGR